MSTPQSPLPSGFTAATTTAHVMKGISLDGSVAIVTGGYSGLGRETVRAFRAAGARVIVPARDVSRAKAALEGFGDVEVWEMDLLDPASIDALAARFLECGLPLDILVNSAGIMAVPELTLDARGHELQFATNHLGHFQLVVRLWPALKATPGARVISVSSNGHRFSPVVFEDLAFERRGYDPWAAYGQSKTANILFALELDRRGEAHDVRAFSLHPGSIPGTGLERHVPRQELIAANIIDAEGRPVVDPSRDLKSLPMGAATQVWCAVSPQLAGKGGVFCLDCDIAEVLPEGSGFTDMAENAVRGRLSGVAAHAIDPKAASDLWALSETLTGVRLES